MALGISFNIRKRMAQHVALEFEVAKEDSPTSFQETQQ
jgi:hypothetical protein